MRSDKNGTLAKEVDRVLNADLGGSLEKWSKLTQASSYDGDKIFQADRDIGTKLTAYDKELSFIEDNSGVPFMENAKTFQAIRYLREMLRAIAGRVSAETKWLDDMGAFDPQR